MVWAPLVAVGVIAMLAGFVGGACTVKNPEHTFLLRQIRDSITEGPKSGFDDAAARDERNQEIYRAVSQALSDWEKSGRR